MNKLIQPDRVPLKDDHPDLHIANHHPSRIWHKLPRSNIEVVQEFHDEWMDGKPKAALESSLIKAYFSRQEIISFFPFLRKTDPDFLRELESISKSKEDVSI